MTRTINQIKADARELSPADRADLAHGLFARLEEEAPLDSADEVEQAWLEVAERRYQRYVTGGPKSVPASSVTPAKILDPK